MCLSARYTCTCTTAKIHVYNCTNLFNKQPFLDDEMGGIVVVQNSVQQGTPSEHPLQLTILVEIASMYRYRANLEEGETLTLYGWKRTLLCKSFQHRCS